METVQLPHGLAAVLLPKSMPATQRRDLLGRLGVTPSPPAEETAKPDDQPRRRRNEAATRARTKHG